jgi:hypothetical protein
LPGHLADERPHHTARRKKDDGSTSPRRDHVRWTRMIAHATSCRRQHDVNRHDSLVALLHARKDDKIQA